MTDDEVGFLRAAAANPGDDLTRWVYADWLEERGDEAAAARGRFVRLQVKRASLHTADPLWKEILDEERDLLRQFVRRWNGGIHRWLYQQGLGVKVDGRRGPIRGWRYTRGMVGTVTAELSAVIEHPDWVFGLGPVRRLRLANGPSLSPSVESITSLASRLLCVDLPMCARNWPNEWEALFAAFSSVPLLHLRGNSLTMWQQVAFLRLIDAGRCSPVILFSSSRETSGWFALDPHGKWPALRAEFENLAEALVSATSTTRPGGSP